MTKRRRTVQLLWEGIRRYGLPRVISGLATLGSFKLRKPQEGVVTTRTDGIEIHFRYPDQISHSLVVFRELPDAEFEFLRRCLTRNTVFFDVGAAIGMYTLFAAQFIEEPIHAFEPLPESIEMIERNLEANAVVSRVRLNHAALSSHEGFGTMQRGERTFTSRLTRVSDVQTEDAIPVTTLDAYCDRHHIDHIDIMKIDVEGHEPELFAGAKTMLRKEAVSIMILEYRLHNLDLYQALADMGFEMVYYDYERQSLTRVHPITPSTLAEAILTQLFHTNLIMVRREALEDLRGKFEVVDRRRHLSPGSGQSASHSDRELA